MSSDSTASSEQPNALAVVNRACHGSSPEGQGNGTCPVCGKPKFRYHVYDDGCVTFKCHSGQCGDLDGDPDWLNKASSALVAAGVPRKTLHWLAHQSGGQTRPSADTAAPVPGLPTDDALDHAQARLLENPEQMALLGKRVGLSVEQVANAGLGWDPIDRRVWLPVLDDADNLLTIIRRDFRPVLPAGKPKSMIWTGSTGAFLYAPFGVRDGEPVIVAAGERDCLALCALGKNAVCFTNGEGAVPAPDRMALLLGKHLVFAYDNDAGNHSKKVASAVLPHVGSARLVEWSADIPRGYDVWDILNDKLGIEAVEKALADARPWGEGETRDSVETPLYEKEMTRLRVTRRAKLDFSAELTEQRHALSKRSRSTDGADFFLDIPKDPPVIWGEGHDIIWVDGEPLMICGDDGTGKSTIDHQLIACRLGIHEMFLDYPIEPATGRIVYLAMDRPEQARRAGARLFPKDFQENFRNDLREKLAVWTGPLPLDILRSPEVLADWLQNQFGKDLSEVHIDSLKDLASRLSDDAVGSGINSAIQEVIARGINVVTLHHQRKANGENRNPEHLSDVFGSRWLTAGQGSVLMLVRPGADDKDLIEVRQLKEPMNKIHSVLARHDRATGRTRTVQISNTPLDILLDYPDGATATQVAAEMFGKAVAEIKDAERKKAERQLASLVKKELATRISGSKGGKGGSTSALFLLVEGQG